MRLNTPFFWILVLLCAIAFCVKLLLPDYLFQKGKSFYNSKNYAEAHKNLKTALYLKNADKDYRYYYVQTLKNLPPDVEVQREMSEIANSKLGDSAELLAKQTVSRWRESIFNQIGENYISDVPLGTKIIRWDLKKMPLRVHYSEEGGISIPDYYKAEINKAFGMWTQIYTPIKFMQTADTNNYDILISFKPLPKMDCQNDCSYSIAVTEPRIQYNILKQMSIVFLDKNHLGNYFSANEIHNTALHEIGHALGIMGHSGKYGDLMYMSMAASKNQNPSLAYQFITSSDKNTLRLLYRLAPDISNSPQKAYQNSDLIYAPVILGSTQEMSNKMVQAAKDYIKSAPTAPNGYIDLSVAYLELQDYPKAIESLKQAEQYARIDNEKYIVYYNTALAYYYSKDIPQALSAANKAKSLRQSAEIDELIKMISQ